MKHLLLVFVIIIPLFQGCTNNAVDVEGDPPETQMRDLSSSEKELITSGNTFSFDLFRKVIADEKDDNVFLSPLSVSMALGMTLNGADGETRAGIKETLHINEMDLQAINRSYQRLIELLTALDPAVKMRIGNSLWSREGFAINPAFQDSLQTYFKAQAEALDLSDPSSADIINNWVSNQTEGRIETIIEGEIPPELVLYLINTVYFKGDWQYQFDPEDTRPADFHLQDGTAIETEMMNRKSPTATFSSDEVQMAELAYGDSLFHMTILMPGDPSTPIGEFVEKSLTASNFAEWTDRLQTSEIRLKMPKFESDYKKKLNDILSSMGMEVAFDDAKANFSKINADEQLVISEVLHKANITVNEEGSEAAAATSVGISVTSVSPSFVVNRPFVYLIRERVSGTILFMGTINDPSL